MRLALNPPTDGSPTYEQIITDAHPQIAAFGGMFLLMLFLGFIFDEKELHWLRWIERPLERIGKLDQLSVVVAVVILVITVEWIAPDDERSTVLFAGVLGMTTYILVNGLGELFNTPEELEDGAESESLPRSGPSRARQGDRQGRLLPVPLPSRCSTHRSRSTASSEHSPSPPTRSSSRWASASSARCSCFADRYLVRKGTLSEYVYLGARRSLGDRRAGADPHVLDRHPCPRSGDRPGRRGAHPRGFDLQHHLRRRTTPNTPLEGQIDGDQHEQGDAGVIDLDGVARQKG